jgi:hypothetical protein
MWTQRCPSAKRTVDCFRFSSQRPHEESGSHARAHEELLLNWFRAKAEISSIVWVRTYEAMEIALYHTLGRLPEPETTDSADEAKREILSCGTGLLGKK